MKEVFKNFQYFIVGSIIALMLSFLFNVKEEKKSSELFLNDNLIELGIVELGGTISKSIVLKNLSEEVLIINSIDKDCDCTVTNLSNSILEKGDSAKFEVIIADIQFMGYFQRNIKIVHNGINSPSIITIRGVVKEVI